MSNEDIWNADPQKVVDDLMATIGKGCDLWSMVEAVGAGIGRPVTSLTPTPAVVVRSTQQGLVLDLALPPMMPALVFDIWREQMVAYQERLRTPPEDIS